MGVSESRLPIYTKWCGMVGRCHSTNNTNYPKYGGRGISVCPQWRHNYEAFKQWALNNGYQDNLQLDRIDNEGNYEPANCRFVSLQENLKNRRCSKRWYIDGIVYDTITEAAIALGVSKATISRWCDGELLPDGTRSASQKGCSSIVLYEKEPGKKAQHSEL